MTIQPVETRTAIVDHPEPGILRITMRAGSDLDREGVQEIHDAAATITGGRLHVVLIDLRRVRSMNRDARQYVVRPETVNTVAAVGILVESPLSRVIGNLFLGLNRAPYPTRLFNSELDALAWLRERRPIP